MKALFDQVSDKISKSVTNTYSTSFSAGIFLLHKSIRKPIYGIYGFVRLADEIVDSFHDYDKAALLDEFDQETWKAIERGISLNPVLNAFQNAVNKYQIDHHLIRSFLHSMQMDLQPRVYEEDSFQEYIWGSAEVVGLMCLRIFVEGNQEKYDQLVPAARSLGAAFQKVNFLRDLGADFKGLGRSYFPDVDLNNLTRSNKDHIEMSIAADFAAAKEGIGHLPRTARLGVCTAYTYYYKLFKKIRSTSADKILHRRIRIPNYRKISLVPRAYFQSTFSH